jgi:hypothetical protein
MLEQSAYVAPELWQAHHARRAAEVEQLTWRQRFDELRRLDRLERSKKKGMPLRPPGGPGRLRPHVPWI